MIKSFSNLQEVYLYYYVFLFWTLGCKNFNVATGKNFRDIFEQVRY